LVAITPVSVTALTGTLLTGTTNWGPITPSPGTVTVQVVIDRAGLALLTQPLTWTVELSRDAGLTWPFKGGGGTVAGQPLDASLNIFTESAIIVSLVVPADTDTRLKGSITVSETVVTTLTVRQS